MQYPLKLVLRTPNAFTAPKKSTSKTKSLALIEPGKIYQIDYRAFEFTVELDFYLRVNSGTLIADLIDRVNNYLKIRSGLKYDYQKEGSHVIIKFAKLDDARMFMLAFSDVLETGGYWYE